MDAIATLIGLVDAYVAQGNRYERAERVAHRAARSGRDATALNAAIPGYYAQFKKARKAVLTATLPAAESLEGAGHDSRRLLMLRNAIAGPGGSAAIRKLWPALKAKLQQLAIRAKTQKRKGKADAKPVGNLTPEERTILETLASESPMLVLQADLNVGAPNTIGKYVKALLIRNLIDQPRGPRKGYRLTDAGRAILN